MVDQGGAAVAMIRRFHEKVSRTLWSIIDSLGLNRHLRRMLHKLIIARLIKTLFCVTLLVSVALYPPSSAHAHHTHGPQTTQDTYAVHDGEHDAHAHHNMAVPDDPQTSDGASDAPNCCNGICTTAVIADGQSAISHLQKPAHNAVGLSSFAAFDPIDHLRPPKHLI